MWLACLLILSTHLGREGNTSFPAQGISLARVLEDALLFRDYIQSAICLSKEKILLGEKTFKTSFMVSDLSYM